MSGITAMFGSTPWAKALVCLCIAGLALGWLGVAALRLTPADSLDYLIHTVALALGGAAFLLGFLVLGRHFRQIATAASAPPDAHKAPRLAEAFPAGALPAVLRCLDQPALVISEQGRLLLTNPAAAAFLDPYALSPSDRISAVLEADDLRQALVKARSGSRSARALLRLRNGGDVAVRVADAGFQAGAVIIFENAAAPPPPPRPGGRWGVALDPATPLVAVPVIALRVEVVEGRITALSTVKLAGGRVFPTLSLDFHVEQPELGVVGRPFAEIWPVLAQTFINSVVAAVDAGAIWGRLQQEMQAAGFPPAAPPPLLELSRLAAVYDPAWAGLSADELAQALGIAEPVPARRLARVAAALVAGRDGQGIGTVGEFITAADGGETGDLPGDALKPAADAPAAGEPT